MKLTVKLLIGCSVTFAINGCGPATIFNDCVTPDVTEPRYDNTQKNTMLDKTKQSIGNFLIAKQYAEALKKANEVCK